MKWDATFDARFASDPLQAEAANVVWALIGAGVIAIAGLGLFWWQFALLWSLWTTDTLRSIGALMIPTAAVLAFRSLGREDFEVGGSWWGLALMASGLAGATLQAFGFPSLGRGRIAFDLLPTGLLLYLYGSGAIILLGGFRTWRKTGFALLLLLLVNPVPHFFTTLVDLPLQEVGAKVARSFAALLSVPVSGAALRLMFYNNELGMFIAPACNGLQSAAALGLLALVIGHLRGLSFPAHALYVATAVFLAYTFNLIRLCALVLFYCVAHWFPVLSGHAVGADYVIGAALFIAAAAFLFAAPRTRSDP